MRLPATALSPGTVWVLWLACSTAAAGVSDSVVRPAVAVVQDARGNEGRLTANDKIERNARHRIFWLAPGAISRSAFLANRLPAEPAELVEAGTVAPDAETKPGKRFFVVSLNKPSADGVLLSRVADVETSMPVGLAFSGVVDKRGQPGASMNGQVGRPVTSTRWPRRLASIGRNRFD